MFYRRSMWAAETSLLSIRNNILNRGYFRIKVLFGFLQCTNVQQGLTRWLSNLKYLSPISLENDGGWEGEMGFCLGIGYLICKLIQEVSWIG